MLLPAFADSASYSQDAREFQNWRVFQSEGSPFFMAIERAQPGRSHGHRYRPNRLNQQQVEPKRIPPTDRSFVESANGGRSANLRSVCPDCDRVPPIELSDQLLQTKFARFAFDSRLPRPHRFAQPCEDA